MAKNDLFRVLRPERVGMNPSTGGATITREDLETRLAERGRGQTVEGEIADASIELIPVAPEPKAATPKTGD